MAKEYKTVTRKTQRILSFQEGVDSEFKETVRALKPSLLAAFANSTSGGTVLIGVREIQLPSGEQRGQIIGCDTSDPERLVIANKAADCIPPVSVEISIENQSKTPFFSLTIPPGKQQPYCTKKGEYCIREDGRTRGLHPDELLAVYLTKESKKFFRDFEQSIQELQGFLHLQTSSIEDDIEALSRFFRSASGYMAQSLEEAYQMADEAHDEAQDVHQTLYGLVDDLAAMQRDIAYIYQRLSVFDNLGYERQLDVLTDKVDKIIGALGRLRVI